MAPPPSEATWSRDRGQHGGPESRGVRQRGVEVPRPPQVLLAVQSRASRCCVVAPASPFREKLVLQQFREEGRGGEGDRSDTQRQSEPVLRRRILVVQR